jgi:hypothetical protein
MAMEKGTTWLQHTDEEIVEALDKTYGLVEPAARILGMTRQALQNRIRKNPEIRKFQIACDEKLIDLSVSKLIERIEAGELGAILHVLKTKGRSRGFGEVLDVNLNGNLDVDVELELQNQSVEALKAAYELLYGPKTASD